MCAPTLGKLYVYVLCVYLSRMSGNLPYCYRRPAWRLLALVLLLLRLVRLQIEDIWYFKERLLYIVEMVWFSASSSSSSATFTHFHDDVSYVNCVRIKFEIRILKYLLVSRFSRPVAGRTETRRGTKQRWSSRHAAAAGIAYAVLASLPASLLPSLLTSLSAPASVVFQNVAAAATYVARFVVLIFKNISLKYVEKIYRYINI